MKFKPSTHQQIDQTIKELLYPKIEAGKTYFFKPYKDGDIFERPVIEVTKNSVTYLKPSFGNRKVTCSLVTFQRLYEEHGVREESI